MKQKHGAMEMSVGTIVTIVLLMSVLVLGLVLVQRIFFGSIAAVDNINNQVINEINKFFSEDETKKLAIFPSDRVVSLKRKDTPKGFVFDVKNHGLYEARFTYSVHASDVSRCGSLTRIQADSFLIGGSGSFSLGPGDRLDNLRLVKYSIPESTPPCTIIYVLELKKDGTSYSSADIFVTIK